ncbi:MAG: FMN-binding protein [Halanaerobium sp.]|nr:FMN-binding protein [Halanaerobium sp.]
MKKILKVAGIVVVIFILLGAGFLFYLSRGLGETAEMAIKDIEIAGLSDGIYQGEYQGGRWSNKVEVTVKDNQITDIEIIDDVTFQLNEVTQKLIDRVIEAQSLAVDVISGSTVTCKAYLKAIEDALMR